MMRRSESRTASMRKKRRFALLLCLALFAGLLAGCAGREELPADPEPPSDAAETGAPDAAELPGGDTVLFYPQDSFDARQGVLVPLAEIEAAEPDFPRSHYFDGDFSDAQGRRLLRLLDYCFSGGYCGFSVESTLLRAGDFSAEQLQILDELYPIDNSLLCGKDSPAADGVPALTTFWCGCERPDTMEKFSLGLSAAREIAAGVPDGLSDYEKVLRIFDELLARITYGDLDTYYFRQGHQLYDALVDGDTVCTGYSDAMYYLCNLCGVDCLRVYGRNTGLIPSGARAEHQWNVACLDGVYYTFDATWADGAPLSGAPVCFALSDQALFAINQCHRSGSAVQDGRLPVCERSFDPAAAWNDSPAGALRSYLWFAAIAGQMPDYVLAVCNLDLSEIGGAKADADGWVTLPLDYEAFLDWAYAYMTPDCWAAHFSPVPFHEENGQLCLLAAESPGVGYTVDTIEALADGSFLAQLTAADGSTATASFTVEEADGRYRIAEIRIENE